MDGGKHALPQPPRETLLPGDEWWLIASSSSLLKCFHPVSLKVLANNRVHSNVHSTYEKVEVHKREWRAQVYSVNVRSINALDSWLSGLGPLYPSARTSEFLLWLRSTGLHYSAPSLCWRFSVTMYSKVDPCIGKGGGHACRVIQRLRRL